MMQSNQVITLEIDKRIYDALEEILCESCDSIEDMLYNKMQSIIVDRLGIEFIKSLTTDTEHESIDTNQHAAEKQECSVFCVTENNTTIYGECGLPFNLLSVAQMTKHCLSQAMDDRLADLADCLMGAGGRIADWVFTNVVGDYIDGYSDMAGAFHIDLDKRIFSTAELGIGWVHYGLDDIISVTTETQEMFSNALKGKELTMQENLSQQMS